MIPVRVQLKNFLCYGEAEDGGPIEFDFDDAPLWSICGDNGAGKSAIFDAITYTLFGQHRGGAQDDGRLIRKGAGSCEAAFEFRQDGRLWRVRRTVARSRGKTNIEPKTWQASYFDADANDWRPVPETEKKAGLERWVEQQLGFGYQTFVASVLLLQGQSDRLVLAKPKERFDILSGLLELEPYRRLEAVAGERMKTARAESATLERQLLGLPSVEEPEISRAHTVSEAAEVALERTRAVAAEAEVLVREATRFADLERELSTAEAGRDQTDALLQDAPRIRCEYEEWRRISDAIPKLRSAGEDMTAADRESALADAARARQSSIDVTALERAAKAAAQAEATADQAAAQAREEQQSITTELPLLRDVLVRRQELAGRAQAAETLPTTACESVVATSEAALRERIAERKAVDEAHREALAASARAQAALEEAQAQLAVRQQARDEATCSRCGQTVDAAHIKRELQDLKQAVTEASAQVTAARAGQQEADTRLKQAVAAVTGAERELASARGRLATANRAEEERQRAEGQLAVAVKAAVEVANGRLAPVTEGTLVAAERVVGKLAADVEQHRVATAAAEAAAKSARQAARSAERGLHEGTAELQRLQAEEQRRRERAASLRGQVEVRVTDIDPDWRERALADDAGLLKTLAARWTALKGIDQRFASLEQAQSQRERLDVQIEQLTRSLDSICEEYRVPIADAEECRNEASSALQQAQGCRDTARETLRQLEQTRERRAELECRLNVAKRQQSLYQRLADLLGRSGLQAFLIDEAVQGINTLANETLARISGGQLQLQIERQPSAKGDEEIVIRATDLASSDDQLDIQFVSGSQKFRTSVALAAGIGQYAGHGAGSIRSLIIDEGFGSLDTQGRQEMIDELHNLSQLMERVIVVSHQDDFQDRALFPTGFVLRKDGQRTEVERFV